MIFIRQSFLLEELENHRTKILKRTGYSKRELDFLQLTVLKKIELIDLDSISKSIFQKSIGLTKNVDEFDAPFIALALELDAPLWSGDKKLIKGLSFKGIDWILKTEILSKIRDSH